MFSSQLGSTCKAAPSPFLRCKQAISLVAQKQSVLLASAPCARYSISHLPLALFSLWILHLPPPTLPPSLSFSHWQISVTGAWFHRPKGLRLEGVDLPVWGKNLCLGAGFGKSGSPWTSWAPTYNTSEKILHWKSREKLTDTFTLFVLLFS